MSEILQLLDTANWRNVHNGQFSASPDPNGGTIPAAVQFQARKRILCVGVLPGRYEPNWWLGGTLDVSIIMQPSPTTSFGPFVEVYSQPLRINKLMLIKLPSFIADTAPFVIDIRIPHWIGGGFIECDEYIGIDEDSIELKIQSVELKVDAINLKIP